MVKLIALALLLISTACSPTLPATLAPPTQEQESVNAPTTVPVATEPGTVPDDLPAPTSTPTQEPPLAARVNGWPIYLADYERELGRYETSLLAPDGVLLTGDQSEELDQQRDWILNVMIEQVLIEQAADVEGIVVSDDQVNDYMQEIIAESGGIEEFRAKLAAWGDTEEDAWQEVRTQLIGMQMTQHIVNSVPETAEHVHARHILVDTAEEAERILAQLQASADFATLAKAYSQDTSTRENGGDLGFFPRGILVAPEVERAAFDLQPGQFSGVIASVLGFHIVQVVERDPARPLTQENLRILQDQALAKWVEDLWSQAEVQRFIETTP